MMGPFGGCFAMRKKLFLKVPENFLVDDFFLNMSVLENGYSCVNEPEAIVYEDVSNNLHAEFVRKSRISAGNFQNLFYFFHVLFKFNRLLFCIPFSQSFSLDKPLFHNSSWYNIGLHLC